MNNENYIPRDVFLKKLIISLINIEYYKHHIGFLLYNRCPVYTNLPDVCRMVNDFANPCCKKPDCTITAHPGVIQGTGTTTPNPALPQTLPPKQRKSSVTIQQQTQGNSQKF